MTARKFPINLWMTPDINLSCSSGFGGFSGAGMFIFLKFSL